MDLQYDKSAENLKKNKGILASVVERMVQGNARKRTPAPSLDEVTLKRRRPGPVHAQEAQEREPEVVRNENVGITRFELLLERERLEREVELQKVSHRRQLSNLNQEILLNRSLAQQDLDLQEQAHRTQILSLNRRLTTNQDVTLSMAKELQEKSQKIMELEVRLLEFGQGRNWAQSATTRCSTSQGAQGSTTPDLGPCGQSERAFPQTSVDGVAGKTPDNATHNDTAKLAQAMNSNDCCEVSLPNKTTRDRLVVTQPTSTSIAQQPRPTEVLELPFGRTPLHSDSGPSTRRLAQELMEEDTSTYTLYVDVSTNQLSSSFYDAIKNLQHAYEVTFPEGAPVPVKTLGFPIARFKPKDVAGLVVMLNREIQDFVRTQGQFTPLSLTYNRLRITPAGNVEAEMERKGKERLQELKRRILALNLEDTLPIDFHPYTLRIFEGCGPAQNARKIQRKMKEQCIGAVSAAVATLRMDVQGIIMRTFSLEAC